MEVAIHLGRVGDGFLAGGADAAHQALRAGQDERRGDEEGRDAHVVQARDGPGGVIAVHRAQHLMAGERGLDGDFRRLGVADFADHHDVRVLAENGAEGVGKGQADFLPHRHLVDAGHLELDRVFHRHDVVLRAVQLVERRIKGGGFAGTGRSRDQEQAVGRGHRRGEPPEGLRVHAQLLHGGREVGLVEHAQHHLLAMRRGQERAAQIKIPSVHLHPHASVLGQAALRDVEVAHDLEARGERDLQIFRRRRAVHQNPVHPVAQAHHLLERLDVNVAGALLDRLHDDEVGQLDHGRLLGRGGKLVEAHILDHFLDRLQPVGVVRRLFLGVLDDVLHGAGLAAVDQMQLVRDRALGGDHGDDVHLGQAPDFIEGEDIERIGHGQEETVLQAGHGADLVIARDIAREQVRDLGTDAGAGQVDRRDVKHPAHRDGEIHLGDEIFFHHQLEEPGALFFLLFEQVGHRLGRDQPVFHEGIGDAFTK